MCNDCTCNGNVDPALGPVCDMVTGDCMNCLNNTMGVFCELCIEGFFGDSSKDEPCKREFVTNERISSHSYCQTACTNCNMNGTLDEKCDRVTGDCLCAQYVARPDCSSCIDGYYGDPVNGGDCMPCACPSVSNSHSATCYLDEDGEPICDSCEIGYSGNHCDVCENGYFGDALVCYLCIYPNIYIIHIIEWCMQ